MCAPMFFAAICMIALMTWVDHESPFFYISHGQKDLALKTIKMYYRVEDPEIVYQYLKRTKDVEKSTVTLQTAFTSPQYRKASWILMGILFCIIINGELFFDSLA